MAFNLSTTSELICKAEGNGIFFAKKGAMIADQGNFKYSKRLLGTNGGGVVGQLMNHVARRMTGENLEMMEVSGQGVCYLADNETHVTIITLEANGAWQYVNVESEDLLAFTDTCHYGVTPVGVGVLSQKGFFTSKLTYNGQGAQVAIKTQGNPLILQAPCRVDPDAVVAWTGAAPSVKLDVNWKTLIGQTSGESYMFNFNQPGQIVVVQPFERESGLKLGMDDNRYTPQTQSSAYNNTTQNMGNLADQFLGGNNNNNGMGQQGGLGGIVGNFLNGNRR